MNVKAGENNFHAKEEKKKIWICQTGKNSVGVSHFYEWVTVVDKH